MEVNILKLLKHKTYELLENYVKDYKTGLAYIYLIMDTDTKHLLCEDGSNMFYGVNIAINDGLDFGEIIIK